MTGSTNSTSLFTNNSHSSATLMTMSATKGSIPLDAPSLIASGGPQSSRTSNGALKRAISASFDKPPSSHSTHRRRPCAPVPRSLHRHHVHASCCWLSLHRSSLLLAHCSAGIMRATVGDWPYPWDLYFRGDLVPMVSPSCRSTSHLPPSSFLTSADQSPLPSFSPLVRARSNKLTWTTFTNASSKALSPRFNSSRSSLRIRSRAMTSSQET